MPEMLEDIIAELKEIEESTDKLKFLLALAADLPEMPAVGKNEQTKIHGCASNAYLVAELENGKMIFRGDSDAQIPKGILAMFIFGCEGATPEEILAIEPTVLEQVGLNKNILSPARVNGAYQIFKRVQEEARGYSS